ncbi:MAG: MFS transporter [Clostridia bacterium]|nr:MFS transporter [Clostridia bacterium]
MILLLSLVYFVSYLTRLNYAAVLLEIVRTEGISKELASLALTGSAITYGFGQLISGYLGDKIKPYYLISFGLFCAGTTNILIPLCPSATYMTAVWCVNGLAQAMLWPPMIKIMASIFDSDTYNRACLWVSWGSSLATVFVYLFAPVMIYISSWKSVFYVCSLLGIAMGFVWVGAMRKYGNITSPATSSSSGSVPTQKFTPAVILIIAFAMLCTILHGALRDGVTNWMPTYISETFNLGSEISILTGVALPLFSILSFQVASTVSRKWVKNEFTAAMLFFLSGLTGALLLAATGGKNVFISIFSAALITGSMHGVNFMLIGLLPRSFGKFGKLSFVTGLLNSSTYIGSAISTYGIALLSTRFGWGAITWMWVALAFVPAVTCMLSAKPWNKIKN